jgi:hypothetical protein
VRSVIAALSVICPESPVVAQGYHQRQFYRSSR